MADEMTMRIFCEGLSRVPFNIPDYPVHVMIMISSLIFVFAFAGGNDSQLQDSSVLSPNGRC
eukprot:1624452-Amphidinium_carterae.1